MSRGRAAGTTYDAAFILHPHCIPDRLPCTHVPIGSNLLNANQAVYHDPWQMYLNRDPQIVSDLNLAFMGHTGGGKSGLMKVYLRRQLLLPERIEGGARLRRAVIVDRKGEYQALTRSLHCEPVVLGHGVTVNPFDDRLDDQQHLGILERMVGLLMGRDLTPFELECVRAAYDQARAHHTAGPFLLEHVRVALMSLPDTFLTETLATRQEVNVTARDLVAALKKVITGSLRGMFDGPTTAALDWTGQVIDICIHPDYLTHQRQLVYQLVTSCMATWLDQAWQTKDPHAKIDFFVVDEAWDAVQAKQLAQQLQDLTKLGRSKGLCVMLAYHRPSDADQAGDAGDQQVAIARGLFEEVGTFFLFRMGPKEAELMRGIVQLSDEDVETVVNGLRPHQFLLVLGTGTSRRRLMVTQESYDDGPQRLTPIERAIVESDSL